ncbi:uncharacterized protein LOC110933307 [Helianthus annuus]|uniref:uncharacterized protein LOC110933307 n=1 Tax=Helianthus annuus TaxID=4232 RepID=UPI000B8F6544|nr:uncharacterized protein LOC110933307 [Helianthus annuus]
MADKVLAAKELEVDSKFASKSTSEVSKSGSINESGKTDKAKTESDCKNCMKDCKVCSTNAYLTSKKTEELVAKVKMFEDQILSRDKLMIASNERIKELTERIEKDKTDVELFRKENEKLIHENRQLSENHEKLKRTIKDSDERNSKTFEENFQLSGVLQTKEKQINQQLDEIANPKLQFQEAKIENERINLKLNSYSSPSFVLQHIVPKPIGKNKAGEDVYSDGTGVGYHQVPPPVLNNFSKKKSGLDNEDETNEKSNDVKLPETIDVTFTSSSDEDIVQSEVVKNVVENVLKSDSDSTEDEECFLNNYIPKSKSQNNSNDGPTLVMYKMSGSDKLYLDLQFPLENVNVDKLKNVFKLVEIDVSEIEGLKSSKRQMNFEKDKSYYKKPVVPPRFNNNNQNRWSGGFQGGNNNQKRNFQNKKFMEKKVFVKSSGSHSKQGSEIFSISNEEFFEKKASQP